jgi:mono/diheme cytochrome c family protein
VERAAPLRAPSALSAVLGLALGAAPARAQDEIARGEYVFRASGGCTCHTSERAAPPRALAEGGPELAGGRPLSTPFGVYYSTNLTPDPETGIGRMGEADFIRAMREGVAPDGSDYFPVFPYTSFSGMTDEDLRALRAYLFSLPAVRRENRPPDACPPFRWRASATAWKWLFFTPKRVAPDPARSPEWNRGRYLAEAVAHCGECHTPRNLAGALDSSRALAGSQDGPEGELAPNLTPDPETGLGEWSAADVVWFLQTGFKPDGDDAQGLMRELIDHGYSRITRDDLAAIAVWLGALSPVHSELLADP